MSQQTRHRARPDVPYHVEHESFSRKGAAALFGPDGATGEDFSATHAPDDVTRDLARRMHYAAWRAGRTRGEAGRRRWNAEYLRFRDLIVVGNRKLVFRAVRRWS